MTHTGLIGLEWRLLKRDKPFWLTSAAAVLILIYGFNTGHSWRQTQVRLIHEQSEQNQQSLNELTQAAEKLRQEKQPLPEGLEQRQGDPRFALGFASSHRQNDCRPAKTLSSLAIGQSDLNSPCLPVTVWGVEGREDQGHSTSLENPLRLLLGRFDIAFAITLLLPICILVIGYDLWSRERELGTLPILLSQPISPRRLLALRFGLRGALFIGFCLLTVFACLVATGIDWSNNPTLQELILWLLITSVYLSFWFACAFWVNSLGKSSAEQGLQLAGLWLVLVVVLPGCLNLALKQWYPSPSRIDYIDKLRETSLTVEKKKSALLGKYLGDHPDLAGSAKPANTDDFIQSRIVIADETERVLAPIKAAFQRQHGQQQAVVDTLGFISPAIGYLQMVQWLTGQDSHRQVHFLNATDAHHQALRVFYFPLFNQDNPDFRQQAEIPQFNFQADLLTPQLKYVVGTLSGIVAPSLILLILGLLRLGKPLLETSK